MGDKFNQLDNTTWEHEKKKSIHFCFSFVNTDV